jgi:hypothetical protein
VWRSDAEFVRELGLRYATFEWSEELPDGAVLEYEGNQLVRRPAERIIDGAPFWHDCEPLSELISKNRDEFGQLAFMLQEHTHRPG